MNAPALERRPFPWQVIICVFAGLLTAEVVAAIHLYWSNRELYQAMTAILEAGWLAVPNEQVLPLLLSVKTAFYGGIFYALSLGAALTTLSLVAAWAWDRFFHRDRRALASPIILWAACLIGANHQGWAPFATLHFLVVPPVVFGLAVRLMPVGAWPQNREWLVHPVALILLIFLSAGQMEAEVFSRFRNRCLLDNPVGSAVNDFYYRYTLYAAQTFKSPDQRLLNTCYVEGDLPATQRRIALRLARLDYLLVEDKDRADVVISVQDGKESGANMVFEFQGRQVFKIQVAEFLKTPRSALKIFSQKADLFGFLRWATFVCLIGQSLIILYVLISLPFQVMFRAVAPPFPAKALAAGACLLVCWSFFQFLRPLPLLDIGKALDSKDWRQQAAALKNIADKKMEIADFPAYDRLADSPRVAVRYRLARALGFSRSKKTYPLLASLLDDDSFNVVYQAYWGLGRRGQRDAVPIILEGIRMSDHWYVQTYAYQALRRLGWKQTALP